MHSATSERASKKSASPRNPTPAHGVKLESTTPRQQSIDMALAQNGSNANVASGYVNVTSPQQHHGPMSGTEGHAAHMEGASGVPEKIEEEQ